MSSTESSRATGTQRAKQSHPDTLEVYHDDADLRGGGWLFFAGTMLGLAGLMRIIDSIWAFAYNGALPDNLKDGLFGSNLDNYAWAWLIVGLVLIAASVMILARSQFARWVGLFAAGIAALTAMTWMPYYPIWALTYVGLAVLTVYALAKYGGREPA
jgi:hypothetical protein